MDVKMATIDEILKSKKKPIGYRPLRIARFRYEKVDGYEHISCPCRQLELRLGE